MISLPRLYAILDTSSLSDSESLYRAAEELLAVASSGNGRPPGVIVQEYIPRDQAQDWIVHLYFDANSNCAVVSTDTVTGTASITVSGTVLNLSFGLSGTSSFAGTATLNNNTLTATFQRNLNGTGPGSFTLTRQ